MSDSAAPHLRRVLGLWDLVLYGIVLVQPIAPVPLFGIAQQLSGGFAVTTILFAMGAMVLTAISYGRMAAVYPSAGSAPVWPENSIRRIPRSTKGYISVRNFGICESASAPETPRIKQETPKSWTRRIPPARQPFMTETSVAAVTTTWGQAAAR